MNSVFYYNISYFEPNFIWKYSATPVNRLYYILGGSGFYMLGNKKHYFKKDYVYLIPQHIKITPGFDPEEGFWHCNIDFYSSTVFNVSDVVEIKSSDIKLLKPLFDCICALAKDKNINCTSYEYKRTNPSIESSAEFTLKAIQSMLDLMLNLIENELQLNTKNDTRIAKSITYIENNYTQPISIDDIANFIHLDKFYFTKLFKKYMNMTPYQYLKCYRLSIAINKIKHGESLTNVVEDSGYSSIYSLSKAIKKHTGLSPSQL